MIRAPTTCWSPPRSWRGPRVTPLRWSATRLSCIGWILTTAGRAPSAASIEQGRRRDIHVQDRHVVVVGQGYVGLPLAVAPSRSGRTVVGIDLDEARVTDLNRGCSPVGDVSDDELSTELASGRYSASLDYTAAKDADVV